MPSAQAYQIAICLNTVAAEAIQQLLNQGYSQKDIIKSFTVPALLSGCTPNPIIHHPV